MRARTRVRLAAAILCVAALGAAVYYCLPRAADGPSRERFERVVPGMTSADVVAAVGGPPGDYRTDPQRYSVSRLSEKFPFAVKWICDDGVLEVTYDAHKQVEQVSFRPALDTRPNWWQRLGL